LSHVWVSHVWMSHVTRLKESSHTYEWVMSHVWMSHVTRLKESCHSYEWVMSHVCKSHVTRMNESCKTYEWVMSHVWMSHVTCLSSHVARVNASCHVWYIGQWKSRRWTKACQKSLCHIAHVNESCCACKWVMSKMWMQHVANKGPRYQRYSSSYITYMNEYIYEYMNE